MAYKAPYRINWFNQVRWEVLALAHGLCQRCHTEPATQVHHLYYPTHRRELPRDLMAVCNDCHEIIHGIDDALLIAANDNEVQVELDLQPQMKKGAR
jgi:hypothetical protein